MTYNVLAWHDHTEPILATIRAENPDILALQELNFNLAKVIQLDLGEIYPYQVLEPRDNPTGIGVFSKFPIHLTGEKLPLRWVGGPQVLELEWNGEPVILVNFHMTPTTGLFPVKEQEQRFRSREAEAQLLADLARRSDTVIMAGDANMNSLSDAYQIITSELEDSFRQAGFGLGHTFPGSNIPESDRPQIAGWYVPTWLTRIDYVFHSHDWETISSRTARIDGVSDHRGVLSVIKRSQ
jgi:endonuclease/exonuclease/phosphatase (EEP) superfamily protein YafD